MKIDQTTDGVIGFLSQFSEADQSLASDLLNEVDLIAADELTYNLDSGEGQMQGNVKTVLRQGGN